MANVEYFTICSRQGILSVLKLKRLLVIIQKSSLFRVFTVAIQFWSLFIKKQPKSTHYYSNNESVLILILDLYTQQYIRKMISFFQQPFSLLSPKRRTLFIISMLLATLVATSYSSIPILFYRPKFQCTNIDTGELFDCSQQAACQEPQLKFRSEYSFTSIPLEYQLYCDKKIGQTNILTLMMLGHLVGAILNISIAGVGNNLSKVLFLLTISSTGVGIAILSLLFFKGTGMICVLLMAWTLVKEVILCFLNVMPGIAFQKCKQKTMGMIWSCWPLLSMFLPWIFKFLQNWRVVLLVSVAIPHLIIGYVLFKNFNQFLQDSNEELDSSQAMLQNQKQEVNSFNCMQLFSSRYKTTFVMFLVFFGGAYVSHITSTLYLNTISGNIFINLTIVSIIQLIANILGMFASDNFDKGRILLIIYIVITINYFLYSFLGTLFQSFAVVLGKVLTDCLWIILGQFLYTILPQQLLPLTFAIMSSVMPYVKFGMQSIHLSLFPVSAGYYLIATISYFYIKPLQQNQQSEPNKKMIQMS